MPSTRETILATLHARLIEYAGAPHGLPDTHKARFHADVLAFLRG